MVRTNGQSRLSRDPPAQPAEGSAPVSLDGRWLAEKFGGIAARLDAVETTLLTIEESVASARLADGAEREFYSVKEFAELVERAEYTVREWCREGRINAQKSKTGRGDAKAWQVPSCELGRYRDHGLLP